MKKVIAVIGLISIILFLQCTKTEKEVYLFSYFMGNGEDGLHLAYSYDGFKWSAFNYDKSFLKPQVGNDKLMRDPCIISDAQPQELLW